MSLRQSLTRRSFLKSSSLLLPLVCARPLFAAAQGPIPCRLGLVTYNWGKDWDIPTLIKNCSDAGFEGVELRTEHAHGVDLPFSETQRQQVRQLFADSPVAVVGIGTTCEYHSDKPDVLKQNIEKSKEYIRLSHDIGGTGIKVRPNGLPKGVPVEKTLEQIGLAMREVAEYGAGFGQDIRLEVHGSGTNSVPRIKTIMDVANHPNAVVCWNCNKQDMDGKGFEYNFDLVKDKIKTVHIHDLTIKDYPWDKLFAGLRSIDFSGWTLLEDNRIPQDLPAGMKANRAEWEKLVGG